MITIRRRSLFRWRGRFRFQDIWPPGVGIEKARAGAYAIEVTDIGARFLGECEQSGDDLRVLCGDVGSLPDVGFEIEEQRLG